MVNSGMRPSVSCDPKRVDPAPARRGTAPVSLRLDSFREDIGDLDLKFALEAH